MNITVVLPDHVAAAFENADAAGEYLLGKATEFAREQALMAASEEASAVVNEAMAPFDGEAAAAPTVAERVSSLEATVAELSGGGSEQ